MIASQVYKPLVRCPCIATFLQKCVLLIRCVWISIHNALKEFAVKKFKFVGVSDPGGPSTGPTSEFCRCVPLPRWVGARWNTRGKRGSCYLAPGGARSRGYKHSRGRERVSLIVYSSLRATLPHEGPGPHFYRCKERVQVYNGGVSMC
jgi:hypothetical protein